MVVKYCNEIARAFTQRMQIFAFFHVTMCFLISSDLHLKCIIRYFLINSTLNKNLLCYNSMNCTRATFVCKTFVTGRYGTTSDAKVLLHFKQHTRHCQCENMRGKYSTIILKNRNIFLFKKGTNLFLSVINSFFSSFLLLTV